MNRIVIIGNGFDLAHRLKTSYKDFIEWYWKSWVKKLHLFDESWQCSDQLCSFEVKAKNQSWKSYLYFNNTLAKWNGGESLYGLDLIYNLRFNNSACECRITSDLFQAICDEVERKNWVDIEEEYYRLLCEAKDVTTVKKLNDDLTYIKEQLAEYLETLEDIQKNNKLFNCIITPFDYQEIAISQKEKWNSFFDERVAMSDKQFNRLVGSYDLQHIGRLSFEDRQKYIGFRDFTTEMYDAIDKRRLQTLLYPSKILLLNFNYTKTVARYVPIANRFEENTFVNNIHGILADKEKMIFGYGDDNDEEYQVIKKKKQNEYLKNIKSINYLQSTEYRSLLSFIELGPYQVCTMGHSCGNSDGTLLNTLFEHDNCVSVKPYYYLREDGTDDYFDIVGNISRNFTDPKKMRDRVVNKEFCEPLPQYNDNK